VDAVLETADQPAHDVPAVATADFDVSLAIDADDAFGLDPGCFQVVVVQLVGADDSLEGPAGHLDKRHGCALPQASRADVVGLLHLTADRRKFEES
jgi:hypothetical protein